MKVQKDSNKVLRVSTSSKEDADLILLKLQEFCKELGFEIGGISVRKPRTKSDSLPTGRQFGSFKEPTKHELALLETLLNKGEYYKTILKFDSFSQNGFHNWLKRHPNYAEHIKKNRLNKNNKAD
jgi:hypothetical protein